MRKIGIVGGALCVLVLGTVASLADDMPMAAPAKPTPQATHKPAAQGGAHKSAADSAAQHMHDQMMKDHPQGMQSMTMPPADGAAAKPAMKDCCEGDAMKPKDGATPKAKDGAMPMKHM